MAINSTTKSARILQSRRYTQNQLSDSQEAFTRVLDLNAQEIYTDQVLIPTSSLPFSGSTQDQQTYLVDGKPVLKYWYRLRLSPSATPDTDGGFATWFALSTYNGDGANPQEIQTSQLVNFISPKYSIPGLAQSQADIAVSNPVGYGVYISASTGEAVPATSYQFDYKTGVLQFVNNTGYAKSKALYISAYQYVGRTLADNDVQGYSGSFSGSFQGDGNGLTNIPASGIVGLNLTQIATTNVTASVSEGSTSFTLTNTGTPILTVDNTGAITTAGSASFKDTQVTGSLLVTQNLTVLGTASFTSVTSSEIIVGASTITLSTDDPVVRFGGIIVVDSGSFGQNSTGSLLWDSEEDRWIYVIPSGSAEGYNSAILIGGPPNTGSIGNEPGLTPGRITKALADDHIGPSLMRETGSVVSVDGSLKISGSLEVTGSAIFTDGVSGSFSGSFQGNGNGLTNIPASGIVGLNLTQIADSNISASVSSTGTPFRVRDGITSLFEINNVGGITTFSTSSLQDIQVTGSAVIQDTLTVENTLLVSQSTTLSGSIQTSGSTTLTGNNTLVGTTEITGSATIISDAQVTGSINVLGSTNTVGISTVDGNMVITGSLTVSGSSTLTNIGPAEFTGSTGISGILNVDGTSSVNGTSLVSGSTILSGSTSIEGPTNILGSLQITGSTLLSTPIKISTTSSAKDGSYAISVSQSAWFYNHNVGIPRSNAWQDSNLAGSYFSTFDSNTNVSEILRFVAGLLKDSAPAPEENTRRYDGVDQTPTNTTTGTKPLGFVSFNHGDSTIQYLIDKGFAAIKEKLYYNVGTIYTDSNLQYTYANRAAGTFSVSSSNSDSTRLFGTGELGFTTSVSASRFWKFFDNAAKTPTHISSSTIVTTNTTLNTTTSGFLQLSRAVINTANPAVIPNTYQDSKFATTATNYNFTGSINFANSSSTGYYHLTASFGIATGSQTVYNFSPGNATIRNEIFYSPLTHVNNSITSTTPTGLFQPIQALTATSRSLSGAPYLRIATYSTNITASNCFAPMYNESANIAEITISGTGTSQTGNTSAVINISNGTYNTNNVFYDAGGNLQNIGTTPTSSDKVRLNSIVTFTAPDGTNNFTNKSTLSPSSFTLTGTGYNRVGNSNSMSTTSSLYHIAGNFGQPISSGSLAYYGKADGFDNSSATFTKGTTGTENFGGETYRRNISNDILTFTLPGTTIWNSGSRLGTKDLQIAPAKLVDPGSTSGYWYPASYGNTTKFYIREVQYASGGGLATLTVDLGTTLNAWSSTSNGWSIALLLEAQKDVGSGATLLAYEVGAAAISGPTSQATGNQNPFSNTVNVVYNPAPVSTTAYTITLDFSKDQAVNNGDRIFIIARLNNSAYASHTVPTSLTITGG